MTEHLLNGECDLGVIGAAIGYAKPCPDRLREIVIVDREPLLVAMSTATRAPPRTRSISPTSATTTGSCRRASPMRRTPPCSTCSARPASRPAARLGRQDLGQSWDYVAAGHAVSLALPGNAAAEGAVILPIQGAPISWRRVVRWHPETVSDDEAERCAVAAVLAYRELVLATGPQGQWWHRTPEHRPTLDAAIAERAGVGPLGA